MLVSAGWSNTNVIIPLYIDLFKGKDFKDRSQLIAIRPVNLVRSFLGILVGTLMNSCLYFKKKSKFLVCK